MLPHLRSSLMAASPICHIFVSGGASVSSQCLVKFVPKLVPNGSGLFLLGMRNIGSVGMCAIWHESIPSLMMLFLMRTYPVDLACLALCHLLRLQPFLFPLASSVLSLVFVHYLDRLMMRSSSSRIYGDWPEIRFVWHPSL